MDRDIACPSYGAASAVKSASGRAAGHGDASAFESRMAADQPRQSAPLKSGGAASEPDIPAVADTDGDEDGLPDQISACAEGQMTDGASELEEVATDEMDDLADTAVVIPAVGQQSAAVSAETDTDSEARPALGSWTVSHRLSDLERAPAGAFERGAQDRGTPALVTESAATPLSYKSPMTGAALALTARSVAPSLGERMAVIDPLAQQGLDTGSPAVAAPAGFGAVVMQHGLPVSATAGSPLPAPEFVTRQVVDAVLRIQGEQAEIALAPEELGSIRLVLRPSDAGQSLTVWVDRPEVLDMLRRNADLLMADLRGSGMAGAQLDFRDGSEWAGNADQGNSQVSHQSRPDEVIGIGVAGLAGAGSAGPLAGGIYGRLDIRV